MQILYKHKKTGKSGYFYDRYFVPVIGYHTQIKLENGEVITAPANEFELIKSKTGGIEND